MKPPFPILFVCLFAALSACQPNPHEKAIRAAIERQLSTYPESTLQDVYKSFYQDRFGPGHMIADTASARQYLMKELEENDCASVDYFELTGAEGRFVRVHLSAVKDSVIGAEQLLEAFIQSANRHQLQDGDWASEWDNIVKIIQKHNLKVNGFEQEAPMLKETAQNNQAVHHSCAYNEAYHPHYRIVEMGLLDSLTNLTE
ncbi:MAG: hypothetical protein IJ057_08565 [Bacteroidales bacterium]|nr:hypothetical protein [Bacteroidales bacterium]